MGGKKKSRGDGSNTITRNSFFPRDVISVDDNIVCEILSRLPVKPLMRFKCVSKHWYNLIREDPYLIDLHLSRSKERLNLLITVKYRETPLGTGKLIASCLELFFATADLLEVSAVDTTMVEYMELHDVSKPLNGLICLYNKQKNSIQVCNIHTREVTPWIKSSLRKGDPKTRRQCDLGFDPVTKEHKVICIYHQACEVLTVGDGKWRKIPACDFISLGYGASVYVNGSIYYSPEKLKYVMGDQPENIVAFDVGQEKFRAIEIPDAILDQIRDKRHNFKSVQLLEIDGHPALLSRISCSTAKMWSFDDDYNNGYRSSTWKEITIQLPLYLGNGADFAYSVCLNSVVGTDLIIICSYYIYGRNQTTHVRLHSYNWKNHNFTEIKVDPSLIPQVEHAWRVSISVSTFGESLLPVRM